MALEANWSGNGGGGGGDSSIFGFHVSIGFQKQVRRAEREYSYFKKVVLRKFKIIKSRIRCTAYVLQTVLSQLQSVSKKVIVLYSALYRTLNIYHTEMIHFSTVLHPYIIIQNFVHYKP